MANTNQAVQQKLEALAVRVGSAGDPGGRARLEALGAAVSGGADADAWAVNDVHRLIDPEAIASQVRNGPRSETWVGVLEWLRNSLIFLPLVVTWYGIYQAMDHYQALLRAHSDLATQPFLVLWQGGFGEESGVLTLGTLAQIDAVLLGALLILSIVVHGRLNVWNLQRERVASDLRSDLSGVLAEATLALTSRNWQQPTDFVTHFDTVSKQLLGEIGEERARLATLAARREQELGDLTAFTSSLDSSAQRMAWAAQGFVSMQQTQVDLNNSIGTLATHVGELGTQQGQLLVAATLAGDKLGALAAEQQAMSQDLHDAVAGLQVSEVQLGQVASSIAGVASNLASELTTLVMAIGAERQAHEGVALVVSRATVGVEQSLRQVEGYANTLHGMSIDLGELVRSVPGLTGHLQVGMLNMAREQGEAASELLRAASALQDATRSLDVVLRVAEMRGERAEGALA